MQKKIRLNLFNHLDPFGYYKDWEYIVLLAETFEKKMTKVEKNIWCSVS